MARGRPAGGRTGGHLVVGLGVNHRWPRLVGFQSQSSVVLTPATIAQAYGCHTFSTRSGCRSSSHFSESSRSPSWYSAARIFPSRRAVHGLAWVSGGLIVTSGWAASNKRRRFRSSGEEGSLRGARLPSRPPGGPEGRRAGMGRSIHG